MPTGLKRYYGSQDLHFITCSCYERRAWLDTPARRDLFLEILEQTRQAYDLVVVGYVVMPEHFHLLIGEPDRGTPSLVMQVLKQRFARRALQQMRQQTVCHGGFLQDFTPEHFWQTRFYDFNVWTARKHVENSATCIAIQ